MKSLQIFDPLDAATEAAMRASIKRFGVIEPIIKDQQGRIIDGHQRDRISRELDVDCPEISIHADNEQHALELARTLNVDRRHLTPEQRRSLVLELRAAGHSTRAIAGVLRTSTTTVQRDLQPTVPRGTVQDLTNHEQPLTEPPSADNGGLPPLPARVIGRDGRSRPARRETKKEEPKSSKRENLAAIGSVGVEWMDVQDILRRRLLKLDPEAVAALLKDDGLKRAKWTTDQCLAWFGRFSTAMGKATNERIAE